VAKVGGGAKGVAKTGLSRKNTDEENTAIFQASAAANLARQAGRD
jgi:hypothetical protein